MIEVKSYGLSLIKKNDTRCARFYILFGEEVDLEKPLIFLQFVLDFQFPVIESLREIQVIVK